MSKDEGLDSDSSGREFYRSVARYRSRGEKEVRVCCSPKTTMSLQDPMPEYVDPELVKLIAQNAPFELDVFVPSLHKSTKRRAGNGALHMRVVKEDERRPLAVEAILSSVAERNDHLSTRKGGQDVRHSCPERMWSDYYEKEENTSQSKRKRPKGFDIYQLPPTDRPLPSKGSLCMSGNKSTRELRGASPENQITSVYLSDEGSHYLGDECLAPPTDNTFEAPSAPPGQHVGSDCDILNSKPWRHGMRKGTHSAKDEKPPDSTWTKRKAEADSQKTTEVRKYMETKMLERRKEQQQLKAEADATLVARKEQQRKLDLHRQAMFQLQAAGGKGREHTPRPAWVSEYSSLCEPPRPWSSSSGELNTYLPPPATPPKLDVVPLDMYADQFQYAEGHSSMPRMNGIHVRNAQPREKRRSKRVKGCSREVQRQLKYRKSQIMKEFYHNDSPVSTKARWKAKTKPRGRKLSSEEVFQLLEPDAAHLPRRSGDLEPYKRSLKRQFHNNGGSVPTAATRTQNCTSRFLTKIPTKSMRPAENCVKSATKDQVQPISKVKRFKPTQQFMAYKAKELTGREFATLLNTNKVPSDYESEMNVKVSGQVIAERMMIRTSPTSPASEQELITDLRKCVGHSFGNSQRNITDEDVLCKWFGPSLECSEEGHLSDEDVLQESRGQLLGGSLQPSGNNEVQPQVLHFQKEKTSDTDIQRATGKDPPMAVRWQRMQLLKNLAEQLVKRVDEACAKKRQIERSVVDQIDFPFVDINNAPSEQLTIVESNHVVESLEPDPKVDHLPKLNKDPSPVHLERSTLVKTFRESDLEFFHQPKQNNIVQCRELTEQEQCGCETRSMQLDEMQLQSITNPRRASVAEFADHKVAGGPISEIFTMMDWNTSDKGSSSPSTGSSSPVILPTTTRFHLGRIKHSKIIANEEKACQSKKEDWIIPVENDMHSIFNVYTKHIKDREKLTTSNFPHVVQNDLENKNVGQIDPQIVGPAAKEDKSNIGGIPLSHRLTISKFPLEATDPMSVHTVQPTECSHKSILSPENDGTGPCVQINQNVSSTNFESLQKLASGYDECVVGPRAEVNNSKTDDQELTGINNEVTILEIGDLKLCQSPTSFHLRLDRCNSNNDDMKAREQKHLIVSHLPNVLCCMEPSSNPHVGSKQETRGQCVKNLIPPMKITYARRVNSKARPDDGCTDDERVVVELHQMNGGLPPVPLQEGTRLNNPGLDASAEAPIVMTIPQLNMVVGNAQSENLEGAMKLSTINEDFKERPIFCNSKENGALQPSIDRVSNHDKLVACEQETGPPSCQEGELAIQLKQSSKHDLQVDLRDFQEWELKLRRDHLEAELQKLDAQILKTRARLHQRHPVIDRQVHNSSSSSLADRHVETSHKFDKPSKQSREHKVNKERHNVIFNKRSDLQLQNITTSHSQRDGEKALASSGSYSGSFVSEDSEMVQKITGTGEHDSFAYHARSKITMSLSGKSLSAAKTGIQPFEDVLDRALGNKSNVVKRQTEVQSYCKMPSAQDGYASEGSEMSTGRGPARRLDTLPQVNDKKSTARHRTPKVRSILEISDQMVETDLREVKTQDKNERNVLESHTSCIAYGPRGDVEDSVNTTDNRGKEPRAPLDRIPQQIDENISRDEGQACLQQTGAIFGETRKSHELPECDGGESLSSIDQCGSQNAERSKCPMSWERNDILLGMLGGEISTGDRTPPCIQQNEWPIEGKEGNIAPCGAVGVSPSSIGEQKEGNISHAAAPSTLCLSTHAIENGSGVLGKEFDNISQMNHEEVATIRKRVVGTQIPKTFLSTEKSFCTVAAEKLQGPSSIKESEECVLVVPSVCPSVLKTSQSPMEISAQVVSHSNIVHSVEGKHRTKSFDGKKVSKCSPEDKCKDNVATIVPHFVDTVANFTPVNIPCGSTTTETGWECLSLPCHMDFSTIKEKLRNSKLANNEHPITDGWGIYKRETFKSPSPSCPTTGGDSCGGRTIASERTVTSHDPHNNTKEMHENSSSPSNSKTGGDYSEEQTIVTERIITSDVPIIVQHCEISSSLENKQAAKSKCLPETEVGQTNSANNKADPNDKFFDVEETTLQVSSTREPPRFLPSLYFQEQMTKTDPSEVEESTISEELENYESNIDEDFQEDAEGTSSSDFETMPNWKVSSHLRCDVSSLRRPDLASSLVVGSPNIQLFHLESGLGNTNELASDARGVHETHSTDCIDKGLIGQSENMISFHAGDQYKSLSERCPHGYGHGEVIGTLQSIRTTITESSSLQEITQVSDNYYNGSEMCGSQPQSESIIEDVQSGNKELSSTCSGSNRGSIEVNNSEESNKESDTQNSVDDGKDYSCSEATIDSAPSKPDFMENGDTQHSVGITVFTTTTTTVKGDPEDKFLSSEFVPATDTQERTRSGDNSQHHFVLLGSHLESKNSKPVELPMSFIIPHLRMSEDSVQSDDTHFSKVSRVGKLSAMVYQFGEALNKEEEYSLKNSYGPEIESPNTKLITWNSTTCSLGSISNPGLMMKPGKKLFYCEQNNLGTIGDFSVKRVEDNPIPVQKPVDLEVVGLSSHQMRLVQAGDANLLVDGVGSVDCKSGNFLSESQDETGPLSDEIHNLSNTFRATDMPSNNESTRNLIVGRAVNQSPVPGYSHKISGYSMHGLEKVASQDKDNLSVPLGCASHDTTTFVANDMSNRITKIESNRPVYVDKSNGGPTTSACQMVPANTDLSSLFEMEDTGKSQIVSTRPDEIIELQFCRTNTVSNTSRLGRQQCAIDVVEDAEDQVEDKLCHGQFSLQYNCNETTTGTEGPRDEIYTPVGSLGVLQQDLRLKHVSVSVNPTNGCINKEEFRLQSTTNIAKTKLPPINVLPKLPHAEDHEAFSSGSCSLNEPLNSAQENMDRQSSLMYMAEKEELRCCEIHEDVESLVDRPTNNFGVPEEHIVSKTCPLILQEVSCSSITSFDAPPKLGGIMKNFLMQMDLDKAKKHNIMVDFLTSMIYDDLLSMELCGFHQEVKRTPMSLQTSKQTNQTTNMTKTFNPKLKSRSQKISEFCLVLKHFLPTGWRSASVRHKSGLFLHVEGLRPHSLNPATRAISGTSKYPSFRESEQCHNTSNTQFPPLDLNDMYAYVQRSLELSSLIHDPSPANWYDRKKPVSENTFTALESQLWGSAHIFENSTLQIHRKLLSDLINETLQKQFETKLLLPSLGMKNLPLPAGGEHLVRFVTDGILEHERYASKHGFDIEKVIAKAFKDEHWEKCSEEARDVISDLAQHILGDLIEMFVYEMVRGWCSYVSQCHVLAS